MTRLIDWVGDWLADRLTPRVQRRIAVIMIAVSIPLAAAGPFFGGSWLGLLIYEMSAAALFYEGLCTIVAAVPSEERDSQG